jgi:prepilin-type N-terminal cleavage/methylation domain-containing protein
VTTRTTKTTNATTNTREHDSTRGPRDHRGLRGFTLLELVVIIAVMAILAAAVAPSMMQQIADSRIQATKDEAKALYDAMVGTPMQGTAFGFVGDIGRLPTALNELAARGSLPNYSTGNVRSVGMGWRGPYVNMGASANDYLTDGFGRNYTLASGQVRSAGPDGVANNADDIAYPPSAPDVTGDVAVTVKTLQGNKTVVDPNGYRVDLYYALNGAETSVSDGSSAFTFSNVPMGVHAVRVVKTSNPKSGSIMVEDTVVVRPGTTATIELWF